MFLKQIELTNFKCHGDLFLSFETGEKRRPIRKTSFILGENGTGKSAILKAIALVTAGSTAIGDLLGNPDEWIRTGKPNCVITATIVTAEGLEREIKLTIDRGAHLKKVIDRNSESLELIDRALTNADRNYFVVAYGASRRLNREAQFFSGISNSSSPRSANLLSLFNPDAQLVSLSNWAMELDYTGRDGGLRTVKRALDAFLVTDVKFKSIDKSNKQLIFSTPDGLIPLNQLSDGYQNVASWVGDLMFRINQTFRDYKDPLKARGLLLIDEIDLHLHPRWQRMLHAFLSTKLPNFQVVATTHSPLTAQQAGADELYALRRVRKNVEMVPFRGEPNKMLLNQLVTSPIFGLASDESVKVETVKLRYREASLKGKALPADEEFLKEVAQTTLAKETNGLMSDEDIALLQQINKELISQKK